MTIGATNCYKKQNYLKKKWFSLCVSIIFLWFFFYFYKYLSFQQLLKMLNVNISRQWSCFYNSLYPSVRTSLNITTILVSTSCSIEAKTFIDTSLSYTVFASNTLLVKKKFNWNCTYFVMTKAVLNRNNCFIKAVFSWWDHGHFL